MKMDSNTTTINDPVHQTIGIHPLCLKIIDTPEFQRLRAIKQCGICYLVYPSAVHTRFEHSIGVHHLAGLMIDSLIKWRESIEDSDLPIITKQERLCVVVAALCHDIGHGPFSHLWERFVSGKTGSKWHHEDMSSEIFKYLIEKNDLKKEFSKYNLEDSHLELIEDIIAGNYNGHEDKLYLFEIVANKQTNIDVDRWDYMLRDAYFFGLTCPVKCQRIMSYMRIRKTPEGNRIEFRDKLVSEILEMFENRFKFHSTCYQHRVCKIIEHMLIDVLNEADDYFLNDGHLKLSTAHKNVSIYLTLTDGLIYNILYSSNENLKRSKEILLRIVKREFYQLIDEKILDVKLPADNISGIEHRLANVYLTEFKVVQCELSMGIDGNDPLKNVLFYSKNGNDVKPSHSRHFSTSCIKLYLLSINALDNMRCEEAKQLFSEMIP